MIDLDRGHHGIGPYPNVGRHGPLTLITEDPKEGYDAIICLDCGYVTDDMRRFHVTDCERSKNRINQTWREYLDDEDFPSTEDFLDDV